MAYLWQNAVRDMAKSGHCPSYWYVLETLASYAPNETGICTASLATISKNTGLSTKQVRRHKKRAIEVGHVLLVGNERGGKPGTTQRLQMNIPVEKPPPSGGSRTPPVGVHHPSHARSVTPPMDGSQKKLVKENKELKNWLHQQTRGETKTTDRCYADWVRLGQELGVAKGLDESDATFVERVKRAEHTVQTQTRYAEPRTTF